VFGFAFVFAAFSVGACSSSAASIDGAPVVVDAGVVDVVPGPDARELAAEEIAIRERLGIPLEAQHVLVLGQNAHLDIDWQMTFDGYYANYVGDIFTEARQLMDDQPRAYYAICEMAFLEEHLKQHPEEAAPLKAAAARGALRVVGGGMTSPDTVLPETELMMRDFTDGQVFSEDQLGIRPTAAYLPDSFGQGGAAPDVLAAAGYDGVAFSRIDGASTFYFQAIFPNRPLLAGSTAAMLQDMGTADFIWKGVGGGEVLAHFMAAPSFYCQGDNIDYNEELELPGSHTGAFMGDDPTFTDAALDRYFDELGGWSRTPYMFVPVGCDFQHPKPQLISYLDGYNQRRYPTTGVWAVAAPFDDYVALVDFYRDALPTVSGELTPYFEGFYGTRADVKRATRDAARPFFTAEPFVSFLGDSDLYAAAKPALHALTRADHHDWVTGTANDMVATTEQLPALAEAQAAGETELAGAAQALAVRIPLTAGTVVRYIAVNASGVRRTEVVPVPVPDAVGTVHTDAPGDGARVAVDMPPFSWRALDFVPGAPVPVDTQLTLTQTDTQVVLDNGIVRAQLDAVDGTFVLDHLAIGGQDLMVGPSFTITDYDDTGGLWRIGSEMDGCHFTPIAPTGGTETVTVLTQTPLEVRVAFTSATATREVRLGAGESGLDVAITTGAASGTSRTVSFAFATVPGTTLATSAPGGGIARRPSYLYTPTFWPAVDYVALGDVAVLLRQSTGARVDGDGVELFAVRNAPMEKCDIEGGKGTDDATHRIEWRIVQAADPAPLAQAFNRPIAVEQVSLAQAASPDLPASRSLLSIDGGVVLALKPAERGEGVILRVQLRDGAAAATVQVPDFLITRPLVRVDATEHYLGEMGLAPASLELDRATFGAIATVLFR
jgi:hypothetical protein